VTRPLVVLVGAPGAGKTTIGRRVATRTGTRFRDTDSDIVAAAGKPIADIFVDDGEEHFRRLERDAVDTALREHEGVLSLGGGAVLAEQTRERLAGHHVVWLDVALSDAATRVGLNRDRPVLALNPRAQLRVLLEKRRPLYRQVATATVETTGRSVGQVVEAVLATLDGRPA
jgi:shikimate kinase